MKNLKNRLEELKKELQQKVNQHQQAQQVIQVLTNEIIGLQRTIQELENLTKSEEVKAKK